jgi:hypothetical protein
MNEYANKAIEIGELFTKYMKADPIYLNLKANPEKVWFNKFNEGWLMTPLVRTWKKTHVNIEQNFSAASKLEIKKPERERERERERGKSW